MASHVPRSFDETFDVVVAGYGFAGGAAAIAAAEAGARVLLIEKMPVPGGISICAGGGVRIASDPDKAYAYLRATNAGTTPDAHLRVFADAMCNFVPYFESLAKTNGAKLALRERSANYPLPGHETFSFIEVESIPGFDAKRDYPHAHALKAGPIVFRLVEDNVRARNVEVRLATAATRLVTDETGRVIGLETASGGRSRAIAARGGVILACGGFEAGAELQRQHWQFHPVLSASTRGNTGDGIRMAQAVGADLWHMWHMHGTYGFRHPDPAYPFGIRTKRLPDWVPGVRPADVRMPWILLDRNGQRFANEYEPYLQDTGHRALDRYDATTQTLPNVPAWLLVDEDGRQCYPLAKAIHNDAEIAPYEWSADNLKEVENGLLQRADSVEGLARILGVPQAVLSASLDRWNAACAAKTDDPFGRPDATRMPIERPPFYVGQVWPVVSNTQGGPVHDAQSRVLNPFGEVIPGLYVAGELGSIWGYLYLSGGNLAECFISGRAAGEDAARIAKGR